MSDNLQDSICPPQGEVKIKFSAKLTICASFCKLNRTLAVLQAVAELCVTQPMFYMSLSSKRYVHTESVS